MRTKLRPTITLHEWSNITQIKSNMAARHHMNKKLCYGTVDSGSMVGLPEKKCEKSTMSILWNIDVEYRRSFRFD